MYDPNYSAIVLIYLQQKGLLNDVINKL